MAILTQKSFSNSSTSVGDAEPLRVCAVIMFFVLFLLTYCLFCVSYSHLDENKSVSFPVIVIIICVYGEVTLICMVQSVVCAARSL